MKIQQMGAKMGQKLTPSKPGFQHELSISKIIEVYWWGSGGSRSSDGLVVRVHVRYLCQDRPKQEASAHTHQGRLLHPKFCQQHSYMVFLQLALKKDHAWTFAQSPPSGK